MANNGQELQDTKYFLYLKKDSEQGCILEFDLEYPGEDYMINIMSYPWYWH